MKSLWADFELRAKTSRLADFIEAASEALLRNQLDFDYLFDEALDSAEAKIEEGRIKIGGEEYSLLLLPLARAMPRRLLELAERFSAAGGPVIAFGYETPLFDEYGAEISERAKAFCGDDKAGGTVFRRLRSDGAADADWVAATAKERIEADLVVDGALARNLIYLHRTMEGLDSYFVANLSEEEGRVSLTFRCKGRPQIWDPDDGSTRNVLAYESDQERTHISAYFHPDQALFFVFTDEPPVDHVDSTNLDLTSVTTEHASGYTSALDVRLSRGGDRYTRAVEQAMPPILLPERWELDYPVRNIFRLDGWDIEILSPVEPPGWSPKEDPRLGARGRLMVEAARGVFSLGRKVKRLFGGRKLRVSSYEPLDEMIATGDRWRRALGIDAAQFEQYEMADLLIKVAEYVGFEAGYDYPPAGCEFAMSATFRLEHIPEDLSLVYENAEGGPISIRINGVEIDKDAEPVFVWDQSNVAVPIASHVREGENRLRLQWKQPAFPSLFPSVHGIEPVCLVGKFWVKGGRIVEQKYRAPALPWSEIGLPNYIGTLTYKSSFKIPTHYLSQQLFLKFDRIGVAAEVKINGKRAGVLLWKPYTLDITDLSTQGDNTIEVTVANTVANLLAEPVPAGLIGRPYIAPYWRHRIRLTGQGRS